MAQFILRHRVGCRSWLSKWGINVPLVRSDLIGFLCERFGLDVGELEEDFPLFSSALLDSIHMVELIEYLERETGIVFEADELSLENFDTVSSILSYCASRSS